MNKRPYQDLIAWQEADNLCVQIYKLTKCYPKDERYNLVSQTRRSSYGVPMNIAEGNARRTKKDKAHFFVMALSSLEELHYQCHLAQRLRYISKESFTSVVHQINKTSYLLTRLRSAFTAHP